MKKLLAVISLIPLLFLSACSFSTGSFVTTYSSNISLPFLEALQWRNGYLFSSPAKVNVLIANLFYGTTYNGEVGRINSFEIDSINISCGLIIDNERYELAMYSVDGEQYSSQECGILIEKAKFVVAKDFKLSFEFDFTSLVFSNTSESDVSVSTYFLINYARIMDNDVLMYYNRGFSGDLYISNDYFSLTNVECLWVFA